MVLHSPIALLLIGDHACAVMALLMVYLFAKPLREKIRELIRLSNVILAIAGVLLLISAAGFYEEAYAAAGGRFSVYLADLILLGLIPQIMWFRRVRRSIPLSLLVAVVLLIIQLMPQIIIYVTSMQRDYLPSAYASYINPLEVLLHILAWTGLLLLIRFIAKYWLLRGAQSTG